jgi:hypothetical protein
MFQRSTCHWGLIRGDSRSIRSEDIAANTSHLFNQASDSDFDFCYEKDDGTLIDWRARADAEITVEQAASPSEFIPGVVPELRVEATVEAYPGVVPVGQPARAEVDELLRWLSSANLPHVSFKLWPWVSVTDVARFVVTLQTELSSDVIGPRWRGAAEDLRQVARLYRGVDVDGEARQSRAPPLMSMRGLGADQVEVRSVQVGGSHVG